MTKIDRRNLLKTVAASAVCGGFVSGLDGSCAAQDLKATTLSEEVADNRGAWFIARQNRPHSGQHVVDFWSKPFCEVSYADHLPAEITRAALWYEHSRELNVNPQEALVSMSAALGVPHARWPSQAQYANHFGDAESLLTPLVSLIGSGQRDRNRTALIALDSQSYAPMEPDWVDILPAFRRCYDRIIGHFHIESRGFLHWKAWLSRTADKAFFEETFIKPASLCDAVIVTSASLVECDFNLGARESTEELVSQLMQRFGQLLLDEYTLDAILPITGGGQKKPRIFALGSATTTLFHPSADVRNLCRQRELIWGSFLGWDRRWQTPFLIATLANQQSAKIIHDRISGTDFTFVKLDNSDRLTGDDPLEAIEMITLWPFEIDHPIVEAV